MRVRILGALEVENSEGEAVELGSPKQQALLALLAIHPNAVLSTDRIIGELWGDRPPSDGPRNVRVYVSRLREALEPNRAKRAPGRLIVTEPTGYALRIDPENIDAVEFERLVGDAQGRMGVDPESARDTIDEALGLWRDRPFVGLAFEEFAQAEIRRLEELHLSALGVRHEASIRLGDHALVVAALEKLVTAHPLRERLVALLMEALAASGRQAEALRAYRSIERRLAEEVGLQPSVELRRLEERILLQQEEPSDGPEGSRSDQGPAPSFPARLTSLVGRETDLDQVGQLLRQVRLLTLTGPGGVGKTSLAIEAVRRESTRFSGRVWLADFSPLRDSSGATATIADALHVSDESGASLLSEIATTLNAGKSLLLLNNCEHVVDSVSALVVELLQAAAELTVVCTSRRSLGVEGESIYEVAPLMLPPAHAGIDELRATAASQLLSDRATAASPGWEINVENAEDVAELCRRLDGIPLAIELAASHLRWMSAREIVHSMRDLLSLGGRERGVAHHKTLRSTTQWSYDLLAEAEQALFDRLSVFAGRFSRDAALALGIDSQGGAPVNELAALIDASMVIADVSGRSTDYRMLPTLRDFGTFNLRAAGELETVRRAHAEYLVTDAEEMALPLVPLGATKHIEQNVTIEDFRAAADWALHAGTEQLAVALLGPLCHHAISSGRSAEAAHWLDSAEQLGVDGTLGTWRLQLAAAFLDWRAGGHNEHAEAAFRSLSASALEMGEVEASADALQFAGYARWYLGDLRGARDDMAAAAQATSDQVGRGHSAREGLAVLELYLGNLAAAEQQADALAAFAEATDDPVARCNALNVRGWVASYRGEPNSSVRAFEQCRDIAVEEGNFPHNLNARLGLARVLTALSLTNHAVAQAETARDMSIDAGNHSKHAEALIALGEARLELDDRPGAARSVTEALDILRNRVRRVDHMSRGLRVAGSIALAEDRGDLAVRFLAAAQAEHRRIGYVDPPADATRASESLDEAVGLLDVAEHAELTREAQHESFAEVLNEAVEYLRAASQTPS